MPQHVGCRMQAYICRRYDFGVKFHGSSKQKAILQKIAPYRPCEFTRSRKSVDVENHVGAFHTHRAVPARDGKFIAQPQISSRQNSGTRHGPHGVQFGCSGEHLPQNNIPHFFHQHVVRLACYWAATVVSAQIPRRSAVPQRVVHFPRGHLDADRGPVIVLIFLGECTPAWRPVPCAAPRAPPRSAPGRSSSSSLPTHSVASVRHQRQDTRWRNTPVSYTTTAAAARCGGRMAWVERIC
ncbi:hypothetical protein TCSYLVIO_007623 [Trypanosoma cruzi]|nr:hypothetical protein TCSYLVIO_007623 [Trypanosoma cruzi]